MTPNTTGKIRAFESGATRDTDEGKLDFEAFYSPAVLNAYAEYMHENREQSDGSLRDGDNWQKGMPLPVYMKSGWRHFFEWWWLHRKKESKKKLVKACCALMFNVMGYIHVLLEEGEQCNPKEEA